MGREHRTRAKLDLEGILTAADLARADSETLRARYGVTLARTLREPQGIACSSLEEVEPDRQQIVVSRSFGKEVVALEDPQRAWPHLPSAPARSCARIRFRPAGSWSSCTPILSSPGRRYTTPARLQLRGPND